MASGGAGIGETSRAGRVFAGEYVDWFNHRRLYETCGDISIWPVVGVHFATGRTLSGPSLVVRVSGS